MRDEPTVSPHPAVVRELEQKAIRLYRAIHPDAPPWQELSDQTRTMWVMHAEQAGKESGE